MNNFTSRKICSNRVCRSLPSSTRSTSHVVPKLSVLVICSRLINPTTFPTVSGTFENSTKNQLTARELTRTQALLEILCGSRGAKGHGKDEK